MAIIQDRFDGPRLAGTRRPGNIYLIGDDPKPKCRFLPHLLNPCPCCGQGITPSFRWSWIQPRELFSGASCNTLDCEDCSFKEALPESAGLLWVREKFYPFAFDFSREAYANGLCVRVGSVPADFVLGKTWVFFAHTKAVCRHQPDMGFPTYLPGVFHAFLPDRAEYVVRGNESRKLLAKLCSSGVTPVRVRPRQATFFEEEELPVSSLASQALA